MVQPFLPFADHTLQARDPRRAVPDNAQNNNYVQHLCRRHALFLRQCSAQGFILCAELLQFLLDCCVSCDCSDLHGSAGNTA